jgi:hypothetical protein
LADGYAPGPQDGALSDQSPPIVRASMVVMGDPGKHQNLRSSVDFWLRTDSTLPLSPSALAPDVGHILPPPHAFPTRCLWAPGPSFSCFAETSRGHLPFRMPDDWSHSTFRVWVLSGPLGYGSQMSGALLCPGPCTGVLTLAGSSRKRPSS